MMEWWDALSLLGKVFTCIAVPSSLLMVLQIIFMLIGFSHDHDIDVSSHDFDHDMDGDFSHDITDIHHDHLGDSGLDGLRIFSVRTLISFFAIFGWSGLVLLKNGLTEWLTVIIAFAAGFITMIIVAYLFKVMMRLQDDGTKNIRNALGVSGTVYLTIPAQRAGKGKANIILQGQYSELNAVTDDTAPLPFGTEIVVIGISGEDTLVVKRK